ncbi:DUF6712 family protein [Runella sp.]|uniref:DUF6712 family protein n=1 Tax=Runella sp. TaxID=1960881 RepID=UPI003D0BF277
MPLFQTIEDVRDYVKFNLIFDFPTIETYLTDAEEIDLADYIGSDLIARLVGAENPNAIERQGLVFCRRFVARLGTLRWLPMGEVQFGNDGITTVGKGEMRTAAYDAQIARITASLTNSAYNALEQLLRWLEKPNILTELTQYATSAQRTENQKYLIKNATEFSTYYQIFGKQLTFLALRPTMAAVETQRLAPALGELYTTLKTGTGLSDLQKKLLDACKWFLAYQTVADVLELELNVELDAGGLRVNYTAQFENTKYYTPPTDAQRISAQQAAARRAEKMWSTVNSILTEINPPVVDTSTASGIVASKFSVGF